MAASTPASPLLALPLELRIKVYEQLLRPDPDRIQTLYHDRHGRQPSFNISPAILRVSQQIYSEAVPILYDTASVQIYLATPVVKQCKGGNYPDGITDPPDLFRKDTDENTESAQKLDWRAALPTANDLESARRPRSAADGCIYPHCFQRLREIQIVTSRHAIWGGRRGGSYFSHTGRTVMRILKLLAEEQATKTPVPKRVRFTMQPDWRTVESQLLMRRGAMDERTRAIVGLLKAVKRRTGAEIEVEEGVFTKTLKEFEMEGFEVDEWERLLLADADVGL